MKDDVYITLSDGRRVRAVLDGGYLNIDPKSLRGKVALVDAKFLEGDDRGEA